MGLTRLQNERISAMKQLVMFSELYFEPLSPPKGQLLKWIGNKHRFAGQIISYFPSSFGNYFEPFLGSGAVLATLAPKKALGSDTFQPLIEIWKTLKSSPETLNKWYKKRWLRMQKGKKVEVYEEIKASYNSNPNGADLLFLSRSCYGGVVRFRQLDGYMSTPCGIHSPISPESFASRVYEWNIRIKDTSFERLDYKEAMNKARKGDIIYCDPPYSDCQSILYGAQSFNLYELIETIGKCKSRGVFIALSIDGKKHSGRQEIMLPIPNGLFEREVIIDVGRSMLKRFQMNGQSLENEVVHDRLLLTY
jgi:DNA adenine methylase